MTSRGTCSVCGAVGTITRGWCPAHYTRWLKHGDPEAYLYAPSPVDRLCSVPDCDRAFIAKGLCTMHYRRWRKYGDPTVGAARTKPGQAREWFELHVRDVTDECVLWPFATTLGGYGVYHPKRGVTANVHRLACAVWHGPPPTPKHEAAHSCHVPLCMNGAHLEWKTPQQNSGDDKRKHGTTTARLLTDADVAEIREGYAASLGTQADFARAFGVSAPLINLIVNGKAYMD